MLSFMLEINDKQLESKLEQIYINYRNVGFWTSYEILNDHHEAEDVIQDTIIRMISMADRIDDASSNKTKGLFIVIARNLSLNIYNKKKRNNLFLGDDQFESISTDFDLEEYIIGVEQAKWIAEKLEELNPTYADILTLKFYYEYTNEEISKLFGITEVNVRVRIHRAKLAVKGIIEQEADYVEHY